MICFIYDPASRSTELVLSNIYFGFLAVIKSFMVLFRLYCPYPVHHKPTSTFNFMITIPPFYFKRDS